MFCHFRLVFPGLPHHCPLAFHFSSFPLLPRSFLSSLCAWLGQTGNLEGTCDLWLRGRAAPGRPKMFQSRRGGSTGRKEISQRELRRRSRGSPGCAAPTGEGRAGPSCTQNNCAYQGKSRLERCNSSTDTTCELHCNGSQTRGVDWIFGRNWAPGKFQEILFMQSWIRDSMLTWQLNCLKSLCRSSSRSSILV